MNNNTITNPAFNATDELMSATSDNINNALTHFSSNVDAINVQEDSYQNTIFLNEKDDFEVSTRHDGTILTTNTYEAETAFPDKEWTAADFLGKMIPIHNFTIKTTQPVDSLVANFNIPEVYMQNPEGFGARILSLVEIGRAHV